MVILIIYDANNDSIGIRDHLKIVNYNQFIFDIQLLKI